MKEYRLVTWPQLRPPFDRIAYRRMLSDMSHRHMSVGQLSESSGMRRQDVRAFLQMLETREFVTHREAPPIALLAGPLRPLANWLRRALGSGHGER